MNRRPPALATWLLERLGYVADNPALAGDLAEEFASGRSRAWYWRQTLGIVAASIGRNGSYYGALTLGLAVSIPFVLAAWRLQWPMATYHRPTWNVVSVVALGLSPVLTVWRWIAGKRKYQGDPRLLVKSADGSRRFAVLRHVAFEAFWGQANIYILLAVVFRHMTLGEHLGAQAGYMAFMHLPRFRRRKREYQWLGDAPHELCLRLGEREIRPENLFEEAFRDEVLARTLFGGGATIEQVRRAIWLGSARNYLHMLREDLGVIPTTTAVELRDLVREAGTQGVAGDIHEPKRNA